MSEDASGSDQASRQEHSEADKMVEYASGSDRESDIELDKKLEPDHRLALRTFITSTDGTEKFEPFWNTIINDRSQHFKFDLWTIRENLSETEHHYNSTREVSRDLGELVRGCIAYHARHGNAESITDRGSDLLGAFEAEVKKLVVSDDAQDEGVTDSNGSAQDEAVMDSNESAQDGDVTGLIVSTQEEDVMDSIESPQDMSDVVMQSIED